MTFEGVSRPMMKIDSIQINKPLLLTGSFWQPSMFPYTEKIGFYSLRIEKYWGHFAVSLGDAIKGKVYRETAKWMRKS